MANQNGRMRNESTSSRNADVNFLLGGGEMGARMREKDWSQTSLGPTEHWPQSLRTAVRIMLTCRQAMFVWWGDELINLYNDAYKAILGGKHPEVLGQPASYVWREIWDQVGPRAESAMLNNEGTYDEALLLIMERNGYPEETYYTFSYSPVPNDQGGTGGIICANTDDTQRIISERQLVLLRELAARTVDARTFDVACSLSASCLETNLYDLPFAMIYLVDPDQKRVFLAGTSGIGQDHVAVPETVAVDGDTVWPFAEVLRTHKPCLVDDLRSHFVGLPTGAWEQPPHQAVAVPIAPSGQTGRAGILIVGLNPFRVFDNNYSGFIELVAAQISASIANAQAYEEERKRAEALAEIDRAKTVFFSNVSHEFRTPLTLMLGPLEETLNNSATLLPVNEREQLEMVQRNGLRLLKLVNTLLDFSRIEAGRVQASYEPTDLASFTTELASVFRSAIERADMQLSVNCPPLPAPVYVDREMWEKIVLNLLSNAFKFTFTGEITVSLQWVNDSVDLMVKDTGIGIPVEEIPHLFERFHRVKGAQGRTFEGSGIGLSLVQELVQMHGGTVQISSILGKGSCFTVSIPTGSAHLPVNHISASRTLASTSLGATPYLEEALRWLPEEESRGSRGSRGVGGEIVENNYISIYSSPAYPARILLADDNADMRDYVKRLLSQQYEVEAVADGLAALSAAGERVPDLVLTDVMMPGLDGFGLLQELRADPQTRNVPIILLSARAGEEARVEGLEAGADDYLIKPFSARELLARVEAALKMARLRDEAMQREQGLRIEAEEAKAHLETVLAGIQDQFYVLDREWRYTFVNDRIATFLGKSKEELLGKSIWELFPDAIGTEFYTQVHSAFAQQEVVRFEYFYPPWRRWFENRVYPFGEGVSIFVTEISDRKQAEAERDRLLQLEQAARAEAEKANRIKDEFLAVLSHELRSPLNPILGWARLLQTREFDPASMKKALATIERNAQLQVQLIDDLLDVSRILSGKLKLNMVAVNLVSVIEAAMETVCLAAEAKNIQINTMLDASLGEVLGDSSRLQQVIWNLVSNAVKFTPEGGKVNIRLDNVDAQAQITVSDTGKGISSNFLPYVFEYFCQADSTTTRKFGGLGLGLAIVRHLVELHGGTVSAESLGEGQGATFIVRLPLLKDEGKRLKDENNSSQIAPHSPLLIGIKILVVDDDTDSRDFYTFVLEQSGANVIAVGSATEALQALEQSKPDILLSDIGMPEMDGYMLMRQIKALQTEAEKQITGVSVGAASGREAMPKAIALTAYAGEINQQQALLAGFQKHLSKPVEPDELVKAITNILGRD